MVDCEGRGFRRWWIGSLGKKELLRVSLTILTNWESVVVGLEKKGREGYN